MKRLLGRRTNCRIILKLILYTGKYGAMAFSGHKWLRIRHTWSALVKKGYEPLDDEKTGYVMPSRVTTYFSKRILPHPA